MKFEKQLECDLDYLKTLDSIELRRIKRRYSDSPKHTQLIDALITSAKEREKDLIQELNDLLDLKVNSLHDVFSVMKDLNVRNTMIHTYSLTNLIYLLKEVYNTEYDWVLLNKDPFVLNNIKVPELKSLRRIFGITHKSLVKEMLCHKCTVPEALELFREKMNPTEPPITYDGVEYSTLEEVLTAHGCDLIIYHKYKRRGFSDEDALKVSIDSVNNKGIYQPGYDINVTIDGVRFTKFKDLANHTGIKSSVLRDWARGLSNKDIELRISELTKLNVKSKIFGDIRDTRDLFKKFGVSSNYYNNACSRDGLSPQGFVDRIEKGAVPYKGKWLFNLEQVMNNVCCEKGMASTLVNRVKRVPLQDRERLVEKILGKRDSRVDLLKLQIKEYHSFRDMSKDLNVPLTFIYSLLNSNITKEEFESKILNISRRRQKASNKGEKPIEVQ